MKNIILNIIILIVIGFSCSKTKTARVFETSKNYPENLKQLHHNVLVNILEGPANLEEVEQLLNTMQRNGSWTNIDYTSQERGAWGPRKHLSNLLEIAKTYQTIGTGYYQKKEVSAKIHRGLNFWLDNDFICPNWWYPVIGVPKVLNPILILMKEELSPEQLEKGLVILNRCKIGGTGQNKVWKSGNVLLTSLLIKDSVMVKKAAKSIQEELVVSMGEGVQPDWSYHQHGPQLQFGNYGLSYASDMVKWISILRKTPFHFDESKVSILRNYLLDGQQWITWKNQMDISACGRQLFIDAPKTKAASLARSIKKMETVDPDFAEAYIKANDYRSLSGDKHFWRSDFHVHRNPDYCFSVKMCSERVIGAESCNSENLRGYYMGDGASFLYRTGEEYRNIFPFWDWKKIPGITTPQDNKTLPVLTCKGYRNESDFVGGVSDGKNGVATMIYDRNGLKTRKSWFMFNDKIICLGTGITSSNGFLVTTSVNQTYLNGKVIIKTNSAEIIAQESQNLKNVKWILHDNTGYYFPEGGELALETKEVDGSWSWVAIRYPERIEKAKIFKLWFVHGVNPVDQKYSYILIPNATKMGLNEMEKQPPFRIVNKKERQEVISFDGSFTGIVFYKSGRSTAFGGVEVEKPCLVMLKKQDNGMSVALADPTQKLIGVKLILNGQYKGEGASIRNGKTELKIKFPQGGEAGKTISLELSAR